MHEKKIIIDLFWQKVILTQHQQVLYTRDSIVFKSQLRDGGHHSAAFECVCANIVFVSSFRPWLSGIFTGSVLVIVLSFCSCPAVTTVFSHAVRAKPRCDSDFQNSVCVTVPGSPVPPQKQTWFSFPTALMAPLFSPCCSSRSSLYKLIFGNFLFIFFSLSVLLLWWGIWRCSEFLHLRPRTQALMDVMFPPEVLAYDSHYPFQCISPLHSVLLRNGLVVSRRIDLYAILWWNFFVCVLLRLEPRLFSRLTSGSNAEWDAIPEHN